jgi:hypothetical protein
MRFACALGACALLLVASSASAVDFANWSSTTAGTLDSFSFAFSNSKPTTLDTADLSTSDFSAAPGSATQQVLDYAVSDPWSVTFNAAVPQLLLDAKFWRGSQSGATGPTVDYTFNLPFTILSGLSGATVSGDTLSVPNDLNFHDGILKFSNVTTLSVTDNSDAEDFSSQGLTFSLTPEPASLGAIACIGIFMRRRRQ